MDRKKLTFLAATLAASTSLASPAQALFGPTCIPTLHNCMCTFMVPCPVTDSQGFAQNILENSNLEAQLGVLGEMKAPLGQMMGVMRGQTSFGIPGLDSIGIDLNGLMNGDLSSLGIPTIGGDFVAQLGNLGIDGNTLTAIARGELDVNHFIGVARNAGLDFAMLDQAGLSIDKITALASGQLDTAGLLDMAKGLNLQAGVLKEIGISEDLLIGISKGQINPDRLMQIAQNAGLDMGQLASVGLDPSTIANLPNAGPDFVAGVLQRSGFDQSITTSLGLDASMIARISTGELPPSAIATLVSGTGIDPAAIVLPGLKGPIRVTDPDGSNRPTAGGSGMGGADLLPPPSARPRNQHDMITIPIDSIPGLRNALDSTKGAAGTPGLFSESTASTDAMCAADQTLISVGEPPNGFGDDVENIHMAISGGTLETFVEAVDAAQTVAASTAGFGYGRSMQIRPILVKAMEAVDTFDTMIKDSQSLQDDVVINDTIKGQLMTARAEKASVMTALTSVMAAEKMRERFFSPLPLFPREARFRDVVAASARSKASAPAQQARAIATSHASAQEEYSTLRNDARAALNDYSMIHNAKILESSLPDIRDTIENHETYKRLLFSLEAIILDRLAELYVPEDVESAWETLRPRLAAAAGSYTDPRKWENGASEAASFSAGVTAQIPVTAYGRRILEVDLGDSAQFTNALETPYAYAPIDRHAAANSDPYKISSPVINPDDGGLPVSMALDGVLQYYLETARRETWTGHMRRGDADRIMTGVFWTEMLNHAPQCLSGPIATSQAAIMARPDMFDLDPNCGHLYWSLGDPGDYIDASHLGGADAALWISKITLDQVQNRTGGEARVRQRLATAQAEIAAASGATLLEMQGFPVPARHLDAISATLDTALADQNFATRIQFPNPER